MKKNMSQMTGPSFGVSFEDTASGGGGTATAVPPAPAPAAPAPSAPASTGAAPAAPAPRKGGIFDHVIPPSLKRLPGGSEDASRRHPDPKGAQTPAPAAKTEAPNSESPAAGEQIFNVMSDDGSQVLATFKSQAEAEEYISKETAAKPAATAASTQIPDALPRPFMGRDNIKTLKEAEDAYRRTEIEAQRLFSENRAIREANAKAIADREAEVAALKAELETARATPAFRELSKEELAQLAKEDPVAAAEYVADRKLRERDSKTAKEAAVRRQQEQKQKLDDFNRYVERHDQEMVADPVNYPQYSEMKPAISELLNATKENGQPSPLRGHKWAQDLLYYAAIGRSTVHSMTIGKSVVEDAKNAALVTGASGAATTTAPRGGSSTSITAKPSQKQTKSQRIVAAAPKNTFFGQKPKA